MNWLKNILLKIWHDSVGGNIVAYFVILLGTYLVSILPSIQKNIALFAEEQQIPISRVYWIIIGVISGLFFLYLLYRIIDNKRLQKKYHKLYQSNSCQLLDIDEVLKDSPRITKITISGIESVGKTTLIENLCSNSNRNQVTSGRGAYVMNFSNTEYKYAVVLDGSGQSQATQNDLALKSDILLILVDHNSLSNASNINEDRLDRHKQFISLLIDRFETSKASPKIIFFITNKRDLWDLAEEGKSVFEEFCNLQEDLIRKNFSSSFVTRIHFSNQITSDRTLIQNELSKIIR